MAGAGVKIDIAGLERQIEQKKREILAGVQDGFKNGQNLLENIMKFYVDETVYMAYNPTMYERTNDLFNSITSEIRGNTIYVFSSNDRLMTYGGRYAPESYARYVRDGYKMPWVDWEMQPRDFVEMTRQEFINHMNQSEVFLDIVKKAIQNKVR